jgi:hypothetical protein
MMVFRPGTTERENQMATNNVNRQNGVRGALASQRSRHVSRFLNKIIVGRVNGRDACLFGITCRQVGSTVVVGVGWVPGEDEGAEGRKKHAEDRAAELMERLIAGGYTVAANPHGPHLLTVSAHPRWRA